ncbi:MAG TPA: arginine--tRNA ligase [Planctomycetota bacterium]|nr:arginine--tRNA ligase [Planctomycetota bacterium]
MLVEFTQTLQDALKEKIMQHYSNSDEIEIYLTKPPENVLGEFAFPCFPLAKQCKEKPNVIAQTLADSFPKILGIQGVEANGPYLNFKVDRPYFIKIICQSIFQQKENYGKGNQQGRVMVEYSSPNTNKPLHIGHVRNNVIGMALANLFSFSGYDVIKTNLINDRGIHICKSMLAYKKWGNNTDPEQANMKGDHLVGKFYVDFENALKEERIEYAKIKNIDLSHLKNEYAKILKDQLKQAKTKEEKEDLKKQIQENKELSETFEEDFLNNSKLYQEAQTYLQKWEQNDPEIRQLWEKMNNWVYEGFYTTYENLGCKFDKIYKESQTYKLGKKYVEQGLEQGLFYKKEEGSVWVSAEKLIETDPEAFKNFPLKDKLLLRSDGTSVYITQDIGTAIQKAEEFQLDRSIYVVANEQNLHFNILFTILKMFQFPWADGCYHASYGMVTLPRGMGKIKSREGTAVDADDLLEEMTERAKEKIQTENLHIPEEQIHTTAQQIALAALKIFLLQVSQDKDLSFEPTKTIEFTGDTGPAIQYSYARICSIFRKAYEQNIVLPSPDQIQYELLDTPEEFTLIRQLYDFPQIIEKACQTYNIALLVNYLLELTKNYASVYTIYPILKADSSEKRDARLLLAHVCAQVIKTGMNLLGVEVPESM